MSLTKEQIEQLREGMKPYLETHGWVNHDVRQDVDALCDLALTALSPGWRPIEEAPKNGTTVWAYQNGLQFSAAFYMTSNGGRWSHGGAYNIEPTHFMPLPSPPKSEGVKP